VLAAVSTLPEPELLEALRQAVEREALLSDQAGGVFRFRHALLAEAVYATLLPGEREALHEQIADALVAKGARATEVAHHWAGAGRQAQALVSSLDAAREAERMSGFAEALRHLERALELWPAREATAPSTGLDRLALLEWAAELASLAGAQARAVELASEALALLGDGEQARAAGLEASLAIYLGSAGDFDGALRAKERALDLAPAEPASRERALALSGLGRMLALSWRHAESARRCEEAIGVARATGALRAELEATATLGVDLCYLGRADEGIAHLEAARRLWEEHGSGMRELPTIDVFGDLSDVLIMLGCFRDAARVALEGLATMARLGLEYSLGPAVGANAAEALVALGEWERAREVLDRELRLPRAYRFVILLVVAELELGRGQFAAARSSLDEAAACMGDSREAGRFAFLLAELELWEGRLDVARALVERALGETAAEAPLSLVRLAALGLAIEAESALVARARGDDEAVEQVTARARRLVATAREGHRSAAAITALAAGWQALAEAEYGRCRGRSLPARWKAAAEVWDKLQHPYRSAYCRWREAEALVAARASRGSASAPARRAYEVCIRLGAEAMRRELELLSERARLDIVGVQPQQARSEYGESLGLTPRECEVIQLLGRGYTNREIADELTISIKTASVHVTHILRKLNAANRIEAASIAHRLMPSSTP
jgi:DNA-binding CsgD family transcriptional regulator